MNIEDAWFAKYYFIVIHFVALNPDTQDMDLFHFSAPYYICRSYTTIFSSHFINSNQVTLKCYLHNIKTL